jgi:hypothetical protein
MDDMFDLRLAPILSDDVQESMLVPIVALSFAHVFEVPFERLFMDPVHQRRPMSTCCVPGV